MNIEACFQFKSLRKIIVFNSEMQLSDLKLKLKTDFSLLNGEVKLVDVNRNAEITSTFSLKSDKDYLITLTEEIHPIPHNSNEVNQGSQNEHDDVPKRKQQPDGFENESISERSPKQMKTTTRYENLQTTDLEKGK